jgi:crossover junction endodeoxyribonuclease RuvC
VRVLGVDPGTATTGFGLVEGNTGAHGPVRLVEFGVIRTEAGTPMPRRLCAIRTSLAQLMAELRPEAVVVEEIYFSANVSSAITVGQARGVVLLCAGEAELPVFEYAPNVVKQAVTGDGAADKRQVQDMLRLILGLEHAPAPDDAADAVAAALAHIQMGRFAEL